VSLPRPVRLAARRATLIERLLQDGSSDKRTLTRSLDSSRTTVHRALDDLLDAGLVAREDNGSYRATVSGRVACESYRQFEADAEAAVGAADVLEPLPANSPIPAHVIRDAEIIRSEHPTPGRPLSILRAAAQHAEVVSLPTLLDESMLDSTGRVLVTRAVADAIDRDDVRVGDVPVFALVIAPPEVLIGIPDASGVCGVLRCDSEESLRWARDVLPG